MSDQCAGDHRVDLAGGITGLAGASKFFFGAGQVSLFEIELAELIARFSVFFVFRNGVFKLDDRRLVVARRDMGFGIGDQRGAVFATTGGQQTCTDKQ